MVANFALERNAVPILLNKQDRKFSPLRTQVFGVKKSCYFLTLPINLGAVRLFSKKENVILIYTC